MAGTSLKMRYAIVYGQTVEYYERKQSLRGEYHAPVRVHNPHGFKNRYATKGAAIVAATEWELSK